MTWRCYKKKLSCRKETERLLLGQFWPNITERLHFADIIGLFSTTVTSSACKAIEFDEITQNNFYYPFKVIQGYRCRYQSKASMRLPISD